MDYQPGILARIEDADDLLDRAAEAIAIARRRGCTVGYVRVAFDRADVDAMPAGSPLRARIESVGDALRAESPATAVHERLAPAPDDIVVRKTRVGAFSTTDLDAQLRERGIDTLLLAGISTSGVVLSTVRDAADRDYALFGVADACADPEPDVHAFLTERIYPRQADVITVADLEAL